MAINIKNVKNAMNVGVGQTAKAPPRFGDKRMNAIGEIEVYTTGGWESVSAINNTPSSFANIASAPITNGQLSISNDRSHTFSVANQPTSVIEIVTKVGKVGVNIETGDMTIPQGIGRDAAIREFWLGFQEHFQPLNKAKYEKEIADLKDDIQKMKDYYGKALEAADKKSSSVVAEKVRKKYGNEKFIMIKPEDLIKFIEKG
jgi:hypothetical protein